MLPPEGHDMRPKSKGFTLTEVLVTLIIFGIGMAMFNTIFVTNWVAYEDRIKRADLWGEINQVFEQMTFDGRNSRQFAVTNNAASKSVAFTNAVDNTITTYTIQNDGTITRTSGTDTRMISSHAVFGDSNFASSADNKGLKADLTLSDNVIVRNINVRSTTEIALRN